MGKNKLYAMTVTASLLLSGCNTNNALNCHYEPVRGSVVLESTEAPLMVSFTPDSAPRAYWFKRYKVDMSKLYLTPHKQNRDLEPGQRYNAIVNIRTTGQCTPYVVYLLK